MSNLYGEESDKQPQSSDPVNEAVPDFSSVYTENFPAILKQLGVSIAVSTSIDLTTQPIFNFTMFRRLRLNYSQRINMMQSMYRVRIM